MLDKTLTLPPARLKPAFAHEPLRTRLNPEHVKAVLDGICSVACCVATGSEIGITQAELVQSAIEGGEALHFLLSEIDDPTDADIALHAALQAWLDGDANG